MRAILAAVAAIALLTVPAKAQSTRENAFSVGGVVKDIGEFVGGIFDGFSLDGIEAPNADKDTVECLAHNPNCYYSGGGSGRAKAHDYDPVERKYRDE